MRNLVLGIGLALATAALVYWLVATGTKPNQPPTPLPAQAVAPPPAVSGNYADDWQTRCGPLTGDSQTVCTAKLDAAYGRKADAPVPGY